MKWYSKIAVGLLALIITATSLFSPFLIRSREAQAFALVVDIVQEIKEITLDGIMRGLARAMIVDLTNETLRWVTGQDRGGGGNFPYDGPRFVQSWNLLFRNAADTASALFIEELDAAFLCEPFAGALRGKLETLYNRQSLRIPYAQSSACSLNEVVANISDFQNDFRSGGWVAWNTSLHANNNFFGSFFLAQDQALLRSIVAQREAEKLSEGGFVGDIICPPGGLVQTKWGDTICSNPIVRTPGRTAGDALANALASEFQWLSTTDEIGEMIGAFIGSAVFNIFGNGLFGATDNLNPTAGNVSQPYNGPSSGNIGSVTGTGNATCVQFETVCDGNPGQFEPGCDPFEDPFCEQEGEQCQDVCVQWDLTDGGTNNGTNGGTGNNGTTPPPSSPPPPSGTFFFASNGGDYCDEDQRGGFLDNDANLQFNVNVGTGGTWFIVAWDEFVNNPPPGGWVGNPNCQEHGNFGGSPPFTPIITFQDGDDGATFFLPADNYTLGVWGGSGGPNEAFVTIVP